MQNRGLNLFHGKNLNGPTSSVRQPLFSVEGRRPHSRQDVPLLRKGPLLLRADFLTKDPNGFIENFLVVNCTRDLRGDLVVKRPGAAGKVLGLDLVLG